MTDAVPPAVTWATRLLCLLWVASAIYIGHRIYLGYQLTLPGALPFRLPLGGVVRVAIQGVVLFALSALMIFAVSRGRNWARVTCSVLAMLAALNMGWGLALLSSVPQPPIEQFLLFSGLLLAYLAVPLLLFHPQSAPWFKKRQEVQPNKSLERTREG